MLGRMPRWLAAAVAAFSVGFLVFVAGAPTATAAAPAVTISGAHSIDNGRVYFTYTIVVSDGTAGSVTVTSAQDAALPLTDDSVSTALVNAQPAPAGVVTRTGPNLTFTLGDLTPNTYTVTFSTTIDEARSATYSSTATATFTDGGTPAPPVTADPVVFSLPPPSTPAVDFAIDSDDFGTADDPLEISSAPTGYPVFISNSGAAATPAALLITVGNTLTITEIDGPDGNPLSCPAPAGHPEQRRCTLTAIGSGDVAAVNVFVARRAGTTTQQAPSALQFDVEPLPAGTVDADPTDNTWTSYFAYSGVADLRYSLRPSSRTVTVGQTVRVTATLVNRGPQAASDMVVILGLLDDTHHFRMVSFSGRSDPPVGTLGATLTGRAAVRAIDHRRTGGQVQASLAYDSNLFLWNVGALAAGQEVTAVLTLRAIVPGSEDVGLLALSPVDDPDCLVDKATCPVSETKLTAVAAAVVPPAKPELPATGAPTGKLTLLGIGLLVVGAGVTRAGRQQSS
jgi:hypothetical protein